MGKAYVQEGFPPVTTRVGKTNKNKYGDTLAPDGRIYISKPSKTLDELILKVKQGRPVTRNEYTWVVLTRPINFDWRPSIYAYPFIKLFIPRPVIRSRRTRQVDQEAVSLARVKAKRAARRRKYVATWPLEKQKKQAEIHRLQVIKALSSNFKIPKDISLKELQNKITFLKRSNVYQDLYSTRKLRRKKAKRRKLRKTVTMGIAAVAVIAGGSVLLAKTGAVAAPLSTTTTSLLPVGTGVIGPATLTSSGVAFGTGTGLVGSSLTGTFGAGSLITSGAAVTTAATTGIIGAIKGVVSKVATTAKVATKAVVKEASAKAVTKEVAVKAAEYTIKKVVQKKIAEKREKLQVKEQREMSRIEETYYGAQDTQLFTGEKTTQPIQPKISTLAILGVVGTVGTIGTIIYLKK